MSAVEQAIEAVEMCLRAAKTTRVELIRALRVAGARLPSEVEPGEDPDLEPGPREHLDRLPA